MPAEEYRPRLEGTTEVSPNLAPSPPASSLTLSMGTSPTDRPSAIRLMRNLPSSNMVLLWGMIDLLTRSHLSPGTLRSDTSPGSTSLVLVGPICAPCAAGGGHAREESVGVGGGGAREGSVGADLVGSLKGGTTGGCLAGGGMLAGRAPLARRLLQRLQLGSASATHTPSMRLPLEGAPLESSARDEAHVEAHDDSQPSEDSSSAPCVLEVGM
mmetsp:Transcript_2296/g.4748  ORF Transcript_2296/g.4748 Transcript_2296/m.4748 type:complete len:213 (+) Transcript_2296:187-825(+)